MITSETIRWLGINFTKDMQGLFIINYKKLLIEIQKDLTKWKDTPC